MARQEEAWTRIDFARWFIDHDQVDEAAKVLEPGDQLALGQSDSLDLCAALLRRGLFARYQDRQVTVLPPPSMAGDLAGSARKPPLRGASAAASNGNGASGSKRTA